MANGLFMTPEQVASAERNARIASDPESMLMGQLFNLGHSLSGAGIRAFGGDSRSAAERRAQEVTDLVGDIDMSDPEALRFAANRLQGAGFTNEALAFADRIRGIKEPKTYGPLQGTSVTITDDSGNETRKNVFYQQGSDGSFNERFSITSSGTISEDSPDGFNFNSKFLADVSLDEASENLFLNRFKKLVDDQQFGDFDSLDEVTRKGVEGEVLRIADQLKVQRMGAALQLAKGLQQNGQTIDQPTFDVLARKVIGPDTALINEAFNEFVESGRFFNFFKQGVPLADPTAGVQDATSSPNLTELGQLSEATRKKNAATQRVAEAQTKLVKGNPSTGQFTMANLDFGDAGQVFANLDSKSDEDIRAELENKGFSFSDQMFDTHSTYWQAMREQPAITAKFLNLVDSPTVFDGEQARILDELDDANNFQAWAALQQITWYLKRLRPAPKKTTGRGPGAAGLLNRQRNK